MDSFKELVWKRYNDCQNYITEGLGLHINCGIGPNSDSFLVYKGVHPRYHAEAPEVHELGVFLVHKWCYVKGPHNLPSSAILQAQESVLHVLVMSRP